MKVLFTSFKGGVGKSSIAYNFALYTGYTYLTNDIIAPDSDFIIQIEPGKRRIPRKHLQIDDLVLDFGAMSTQLDAKVSHAVQQADLVVVPTLTDARSRQATIDTVNLVRASGKPVAIIINNYRLQKEFEATRDYLLSRLGRIPIFDMKATTLFSRVSRDGAEWLLNVHHDKGEYQLNKTRQKHEAVYDRLLALGERK